eukprot:901004-Prymnesium_polylepis.2
MFTREHGAMRSVLTEAGYDEHLVDYAIHLRVQAAASQPNGVAQMEAQQDTYEAASQSFDANKYLARVADLDRPIDLTRDPMAAAMLQPRQRPPSPPPATGTAPKSFPLPKPLSPEAKRRLADTYWANAEAAAPQCFGAAELSSNSLTTIIPGRAWVDRSRSNP